MGVTKHGIAGQNHENGVRRTSVSGSIVPDENRFKTQDEFLTAVGQQILLLRTKQRYTREHLAEQADISAKYLYEIENGVKSFSAYILYRLLQALNVPLDSMNMEALPKNNDEPWHQLSELVNNGFGEDLKQLIQIIQKIIRSSDER